MMIGSHMSRIGQGPRVILSISAVAFAVVGGSFAAALALWPEQSGAEIRTHIAAKIGPGYGQMRAIDFGKPEKPVYTAQAAGAQSSPHIIAAKRAATPATLQVSANIAPAERPNPLAVAGAQPPYSAPDIHRVY